MGSSTYFLLTHRVGHPRPLLSIRGENEPHSQKPDLAYCVQLPTGKQGCAQKGRSRDPRHKACRLGWPRVTRALAPTQLRTWMRQWEVSQALGETQ